MGVLVPICRMLRSRRANAEVTQRALGMAVLGLRRRESTGIFGSHAARSDEGWLDRISRFSGFTRYPGHFVNPVILSKSLSKLNRLTGRERRCIPRPQLFIPLR